MEGAQIMITGALLVPFIIWIAVAIIIAFKELVVGGVNHYWKNRGV